jgi:hypothetical protein
MHVDSTIDRRDFTLKSILAILAGATITIVENACGGGSTTTPSSPATPTPQPTATPTQVTDKTGTISANHGHVAVITAAQLTAGGGVSLDIHGTATHTHTVTLSSSEIVAIAGNQRVSKESTTDNAHSHTVTFN